jgi:hypothetical protein
LANRCWFAVLALMGGTTLQADVFSFSYSGGGITTSGQMTASVTVGNIYSITNVVGTRNGVSISDPAAGNGTFIFGGNGSLSTGAFNFLLNGLKTQSDLISFAKGVYAEAGWTGASVGSNFTVGRMSVPEPEAWLLLLAMGLGVWLMARKLQPRRTAPL